MKIKTTIELGVAVAIILWVGIMLFTWGCLNNFPMTLISIVMLLMSVAIAILNCKNKRRK